MKKKNFTGKSKILSKFTVSIKDQTIKNIQKFEDSVQNENQELQSVKEAKPKIDFEKSIESIWEKIKSGEINFNKAIIGYDLMHRMVLNYSNMVQILKLNNYGPLEISFFIDDFYKTSLKINNSPIIMVDKNTYEILQLKQ